MEGKQQLQFRVILGLYWDDEKENRIYCLGFRVILGLDRYNGKKMDIMIEGLGFRVGGNGSKQ